MMDSHFLFGERVAAPEQRRGGGSASFELDYNGEEGGSWEKVILSINRFITGLAEGREPSTAAWRAFFGQGEELANVAIWRILWGCWNCKKKKNKLSLTSEEAEEAV